MTQKIETAADRNRRIAKAKQELHTVTCECGCEWKCIRRGVNFWIESGLMPTELAAKVVALRQQNGNASDQEMIGSMTVHELFTSIAFTSKAVRLTAVEPKIVENPREGENEIGFDAVNQCCYDVIREFQFPGGGKAVNLETFPAK